MTASVWVNQYKRNREFDKIYSSNFHDTFHVSRNLIKTSYYYIRSKSLIALYSTQQEHPPGVSSGFLDHFPEAQFTNLISERTYLQIYFVPNLIYLVGKVLLCGRNFPEAQSTNLISRKRLERLLFGKETVKSFQIHGFIFINSDRNRTLVPVADKIGDSPIK